jgi:hypothetical protein
MFGWLVRLVLGILLWSLKETGGDDLSARNICIMTVGGAIIIGLAYYFLR